MDGSRRLGGREDGGGERGHRAEMTSVVGALSRNSYVLSDREARQTSGRKVTSPADITMVPGVWCAECGWYKREGGL